MLSLTGGYIGFFKFRGSNYYYFIFRGFVFFGGFAFFDGKRRFRWLRHDTTHKTDTTRLPNNSNRKTNQKYFYVEKSHTDVTTYSLLKPPTCNNLNCYYYLTEGSPSLYLRTLATLLFCAGRFGLFGLTFTAGLAFTACLSSSNQRQPLLLQPLAQPAPWFGLAGVCLRRQLTSHATFQTAALPH